jgi:hypothetical protein
VSAHRLASSFADGQLYAYLRGFDPVGRVADPADVLHTFLGALGVAHRRGGREGEWWRAADPTASGI